MNKNLVGLILGIMCLILTYGICMQIKTVSSTSSTISTNTAENELRNNVLKQKEKYDNRYKELERAEKTLEEERKSATANNTELSGLEEQIKNGNRLAGLTDVTGPGVIITLRDSQGLSSLYVDPNDGIVHDLDLISIVNELKNAGAEAISINNQRVMPSTSISCDGNVIKVNGEKIGVPFEIKAIGLPEQLSGALERTGGYLEYLKGYGIITNLDRLNNVTIPKYSGVINFKYAENVK